MKQSKKLPFTFLVLFLVSCSKNNDTLTTLPTQWNPPSYSEKFIADQLMSVPNHQGSDVSEVFKILDNHKKFDFDNGAFWQAMADQFSNASSNFLSYLDELDNMKWLLSLYGPKCKGDEKQVGYLGKHNFILTAIKYYLAKDPQYNSTDHLKLLLSEMQKSRVQDCLQDVSKKRYDQSVIELGQLLINKSNDTRMAHIDSEIAQTLLENINSSEEVATHLYTDVNNSPSIKGIKNKFLIQLITLTGEKKDKAHAEQIEVSLRRLLSYQMNDEFTHYVKNISRFFEFDSNIVDLALKNIPYLELLKLLKGSLGQMNAAKIKIDSETLELYLERISTIVNRGKKNAMEHYMFKIVDARKKLAELVLIYSELTALADPSFDPLSKILSQFSYHYRRDVSKLKKIAKVLTSTHLELAGTHSYNLLWEDSDSYFKEVDILQRAITWSLSKEIFTRITYLIGDKAIDINLKTLGIGQHLETVKTTIGQFVIAKILNDSDKLCELHKTARAHLQIRHSSTPLKKGVDEHNEGIKEIYLDDEVVSFPALALKGEKAQFCFVIRDKSPLIDLQNNQRDIDYKMGSFSVLKKDSNVKLNDSQRKVINKAFKTTSLMKEEYKMKTSPLKKFTQLATLLVSFMAIPTLGQDNAEEISSYGDLFIVDEKIALKGRQEHSLMGGTVVNHSLYDIYNVDYTFSYYLSNIFNIGINATYNWVNENNKFDKIRRELIDSGTIENDYPDYSTFLKIGIVPIRGTLNLFNAGSINYSVITELGGGLGMGIDTYTGGYGFLGAKFDFTDYFGLIGGVKQNAFKIKDDIESNTTVQMGTSFTF